jgi:hypothetical protein
MGDDGQGFEGRTYRSLAHPVKAQSPDPGGIRGFVWATGLVGLVAGTAKLPCPYGDRFP